MSSTTPPEGPEPGGATGPADLRVALADYVHALHQSWWEAIRTAGADPAALPLGTGPFTVAVVAAQELHLLATRDPLPPRAAHEQPIEGRLGELVWEVRFLDATVVPSLAGPAPGDGAEVTGLLGIDTTLYHLRVTVDGALSAHQAMHAGTGLAHAHLPAAGGDRE
jgi:hypothetical protein